jgi:tetrapyrrole methylase family protein/MazG family protein
MIKIIGLGSGEEKYLTLETVDILKNEKNIFLRTEIHPSISFLKKNNIKYKSFDSFYKKVKSFEEIYNSITNKLIEKAKKKDIVYAVPGNPIFAEKSVFLLLKKAREENIECKIFPAISFLDSIFSKLEFDPLDNLLILDATNLKSLKLKKNVSVLILQVYARHIASELKIYLMDFYSDTYPIKVLQNIGIEKEEKVFEIPLYKLDRIDNINHLTSIFIPSGRFPIKDEEVFIDGNTSINRLLNIVSFLRGPEGCPWDRKQTHESIKKNIIEEAYEVVDAIEKKDKNLLKEELGDLLLQIVLQSQIAEEENSFDFEEVAEDIGNKIIRRHPHVFKKEEFEALTPEDVKKLWEKIKNDEKDKKNKKTSYLSDIPKALPSIIKAEKIQRKVSSLGFEWKNLSDVFDKLKEEEFELKQAMNKNDKSLIEEEIGDLFFTLVNISRWLKVDPDLALSKANDKFIKRFNNVEKEVKKLKKKFKDFSIEELEKLWERCKKQ